MSLSIYHRRYICQRCREKIRLCLRSMVVLVSLSSKNNVWSDTQTLDQYHLTFAMPSSHSPVNSSLTQTSKRSLQFENENLTTSKIHYSSSILFLTKARRDCYPSTKNTVLHLGCQHYHWRVKDATYPNNASKILFASVMVGSSLEYHQIVSVVRRFLSTMPSRARKRVSSLSVRTSWETSSPKPWKKFATTCRSSHPFKLWWESKTSRIRQVNWMKLD